MESSGISIHQFAIDCTPGDGISNGIFFTRKLLRLAGVHSNIYCADIHPDLADETLPLDKYQPGKAQALLIHHGIANRCESWLRNLPEHKFMVFHNITPGNLFPADHPIQPDLCKGWQQVKDWKYWLTGTIADSQRNAQELIKCGHKPELMAEIPLLVDLQRVSPKSPHLTRPTSTPLTLLFVGRVMPHKNQIALVETVAELMKITGQPVKLLLVGAYTVPQYSNEVKKRIEELGLSEQVVMTGKVSDKALQDMYHQADLFICLSQHEGFGMPLIEAMAHDLPVIAYNAPASNITETLSNAGILLPSADPTLCARTIAALLTDHDRLQHLHECRKERLQEFAYQPLYDRLRNYLYRFDVRLPARELS